MEKFHLIKLVALVIATSFGAYIGAQELFVAIDERNPSVFDVSEMPRAYDDENWVEVKGRIAVESMHARLSDHRAHADKRLFYVHVPVIADTWEVDDPVFVLATFGPMSEAELASWKHTARGLTSVRGQARPVPLPDTETMFPRLTLGEPLLVINEGTAPDATASILFLSTMLIFSGLGAITLREIYRERRDTPDSGAEQPS